METSLPLTLITFDVGNSAEFGELYADPPSFTCVTMTPPPVVDEEWSSASSRISPSGFSSCSERIVEGDGDDDMKRDDVAMCFAPPLVMQKVDDDVVDDGARQNAEETVDGTVTNAFTATAASAVANAAVATTTRAAALQQVGDVVDDLRRLDMLKCLVQMIHRRLPFG